MREPGTRLEQTGNKAKLVNTVAATSFEIRQGLQSDRSYPVEHRGTGLRANDPPLGMLRFCAVRNDKAGPMNYECHECGSPAVTLPEALDENAYVLCRDRHSPVATWAVFKRATTQAVLADFREMGAGSRPISYDPLDPGLLRAVEGRL